MILMVSMCQQIKKRKIMKIMQIQQTMSLTHFKMKKNNSQRQKDYEFNIIVSKNFKEYDDDDDYNDDLVDEYEEGLKAQFDD